MLEVVVKVGISLDFGVVRGLRLSLRVGAGLGWMLRERGAVLAGTRYLEVVLMRGPRS